MAIDWAIFGVSFNKMIRPIQGNGFNQETRNTLISERIEFLQTEEERMSRKKSLPVFLGVASVWFGAHCGPGVASGNQIATYYSRFSIWGLFTGLIAMIILGLCIYYSVEYARRAKTYDFKSFANRFFHPYEKFFSTFFELSYVATVLLVLGSCIATGAQALSQQFGWSTWVGIALLCGITILLTIFGAAVVRASSLAMTVLILVAIGTIIVVGLLSAKSQFSLHWHQGAGLPATLPKFSGSLLLPALWSAVLYCGFQSAGNMANAVSVAEGMKSRKDSIKATVVGVIANAALIYGVAFLLFAFPGVLGEFFNPNRQTKSFIPNLEVVNLIHQDALVYLYVLVLILAILTTLVGFAFAVIARYGKYLPVRAGVGRDLLTVVILLVLCGIVSSLGLDVIVGKGFKYLAYACIVVVIIPTILIGHRKLKSLAEEPGA